MTSYYLEKGLIFLARWTLNLSKDERGVYNSIRELKSVLNNGSDLEELVAYRRDVIPQTYSDYFFCDGNRFKPYFNKRINELREKFDEKIKSMQK